VQLVLWGALIGLPAALVAAGFLGTVHTIEDWLWEGLPDRLESASPPWYLVLGLPVVGAALVVAARLWLPGDGGHPPLKGLSLEPVRLSHAPGVVVAALGTLPFGAVLGPEMPVIALGTVVGVAVTRFVPLSRRSATLAMAGAFSAISALFGGPIVAGILLVEAGLGRGTALIPALLPGLVAAAVGYVIFIGFGNWGGLDAPGLTIPALPTYDGTQLGHLAIAVAIGTVTALLVILARRAAEGLDALRELVSMPVLLLSGGCAVGIIALVATGFQVEAQDVLFSGQASVPVVVSADSTRIVVVLVVAKFLAYTVSQGCGFLGGPIFPAVFLGVGVASLAVVWFDVSPTFAIAVGAAAGMAAQTRLLIAPLVFAALLVGVAGTEALPAAVMATTASWITATAVAPHRPDAIGSPTPEPG
jgi:H+/Cl- antiporter ClcA